MHHEIKALAYKLWKARKALGIPGDALGDWTLAEALLTLGAKVVFEDDHWHIASFELPVLGEVK